MLERSAWSGKLLWCKAEDQSASHQLGIGSMLWEELGLEQAEGQHTSLKNGNPPGFGIGADTWQGGVKKQQYFTWTHMKPQQAVPCG